MTTRVDALAARVRDADAVVAFTGAGVSAASGIPTFRGEDGVWGDEFDPADFHVDRFRNDPAGFWRERLALYERMAPDGVAPNAAHRALADLEAAGELDAVITQNTDGLHRDAGTESLVELHGTNREVECVDCGARADAAPVRERVRDGDLPPTCEACGGLLKPAVVLFGERLPRGALDRARDLARESDLLIATGSSLTVEPAASIPRKATYGGSLAVVNLDSTPQDALAEVVIHDDATDVLPAVVDAIVDS
ncbi:Sir2 family NAD-dependent protein deacetylase [Halocalculus aciditolerans]|uniref:NAD-dependent deacetylase n=1 Tax=Halocalculus aciditolerans TaxID=1383812 RepID=A0A830FP85_9EURY|nr:Sir2 family NAD-dependent protein deacetylase [Halocalculus aciditolerans]GGL66827.1 NAD-dependent deacetylase [Halocalculus aciditolerans]